MKDGFLLLQGTYRSGVFIAGCSPVRTERDSGTKPEIHSENQRSVLVAMSKLTADKETEKL